MESRFQKQDLGHPEPGPNLVKTRTFRPVVVTDWYIGDLIKLFIAFGLFHFFAPNWGGFG